MRFEQPIIVPRPTQIPTTSHLSTPSSSLARTKQTIAKMLYSIRLLSIFLFSLLLQPILAVKFELVADKYPKPSEHGEQ